MTHCGVGSQVSPVWQGLRYMFTPEELELLDSYPDDDEEEALEAPDLENLGLENDDVKGKKEQKEQNEMEEMAIGRGRRIRCNKCSKFVWKYVDMLETGWELFVRANQVSQYSA